MRDLLLTVLTLACLRGAPVLAQVWVEVGDAQELTTASPGQTTVGAGPLIRIEGAAQHAFQPGPDDIDFFAIRITDPGQFSAQITGGAGPFRLEWLFAEDFRGVVHNQSGTLPGSFVPAPGLYYIGVSFGNHRRAMDAFFQELWSPAKLPAAPNGPGAGSPVDNWFTTLIGLGGPPAPYTIDLTGAAFAEAPACYPDCDGVSGLTVQDFGCFQTKFVAGDPYADCDGVNGLTVQDFGCFQTKFVSGCP